MFHHYKIRYTRDGLITSYYFGTEGDENFKLDFNESVNQLKQNIYSGYRMYAVAIIVRMILDRKKNVQKKLYLC